MGTSFLVLLYLQVSYIEEMVKMRKEQFDDSVQRSLYQVSKYLELEETKQWLINDINETDRKALSQPTAPDIINQRRYTIAPDGSVTMLEMNTIKSRPPLPKGNGITGKNTIPQTSRNLTEAIKNRFQYQRYLLDEVVWQMLYHASDKPLSERIDFTKLDNNLKSEFINNGINIVYHFMVTDRNGHEIYRCPDYDPKGSEVTYTQNLFQNDPPPRMCMLKVHFPGQRDFIFSSISFMIPSMVFMFVLLITFIFTIYIIFRQKKLTEMKNDFINNMTHEFKTPISTISLAAQMLKDPAVGKSPQMFQHISGIINDETKRLRFQVEKVLQMSMFDKQRATLKMKELDMNELIQGVVNTFALKVESYNGRIISELEAPNALISADEMHITNVIFNLMDNAVKYKKPEEDLQLTVRTWNESDRLMISIQDNGIGIKKDDLKKIFDKFYRVHTGYVHDVKGFGLGLAYVKKIVTDHKGTIRVESEYNVGTKFIIALPIK
jgi:two-component system phosphate regulon sensor histidine kinase PhoR